jgi:hypothetical protein
LQMEKLKGREIVGGTFLIHFLLHFITCLNVYIYPLVVEEGSRKLTEGHRWLTMACSIISDSRLAATFRAQQDNA